MTEVGIFFGSSKGATKRVARKIAHAFGGETQVHDVKKACLADVERCDLVIFGSPTYEKGKLKEHWKDFLKVLKETDLSDKLVAVFALGDQKKYPKTFADALAPLAKRARKGGARLIGRWSADGYSFKESKGLKKGRFLGLVIDDDRQAAMTTDRVIAWVAQLKDELADAEREAAAGA